MGFLINVDLIRMRVLITDDGVMVVVVVDR
jgi:hypothetical protein